MSESIVIKSKFQSDVDSKETEETIFRIVQYGCEKRIAVKVYQKGLECFELAMVNLENDEIMLSLSDSYSRELVTPLIGSNRDYEVIKYRPESLIKRLNNLQDFFMFIYNQENVEKLDVLLTSEDIIYESHFEDVQINNFSSYMEPLIQYAKYPSFHYQFSWKKDETIASLHCDT